METLFIYLIKSTALLLLFYTTYYFLLKKDTFFTTNRWFLLLGIFVSALLPLLTFQKTVWVEPVIYSTQNIHFEPISDATINNVPMVENTVISWELLIGILYGIGLLIFVSQLLIELYSLRKIVRSKCKFNAEGFQFIEVNEPISPFSFFKTIVYNPGLFEAQELQNIIAHEKIHAKQLHSLDVLIARIHCILFWWNPLVWFYKKAMIQNLEFIADQNALAKALDKKSYLLTLLKITTAENPVAITNHFYQSLIKKRIVMLHTNQSKKHHSWKYFVVLPALVFFMLTYQVEVVAQEKPVEKLRVDTVSTKFELKITASSKDKEINEQVLFFKEKFGITIKINKISRNKKGEINKLSISLTDKKGSTKVYDVSDSEAIKPFSIFVNTDENDKHTFGFSASTENQHLKNHFEAVEKNTKTDSGQPDKEVTISDDGLEKEPFAVEEFFETSSSKDVINLIIENTKVNYKKAFISLNGREISAAEMEKINPMKVRTVIQLPSNEITNEIQKYGPKAVNGVIIIETSENEISGIDQIAAENSNFNLDKENGGFIINKRSQKSDFKFYEKHLEQIGVKVKLSGIERNSEGFITAIKIKLVDQERNHKMSENWTTSRNPNGIPDISIGRKKGKLALSAN